VIENIRSTLRKRDKLANGTAIEESISLPIFPCKPINAACVNYAKSACQIVRILSRDFDFVAIYQKKSDA